MRTAEAWQGKACCKLHWFNTTEGTRPQDSCHCEHCVPPADPIKAVLEQAGREPWQHGMVPTERGYKIQRPRNGAWDDPETVAYSRAEHRAIVHAVNSWAADQERLRVAREALRIASNALLSAQHGIGDAFAAYRYTHIARKRVSADDASMADEHETMALAAQKEVDEAYVVVRAALAALEDKP